MKLMSRQRFLVPAWQGSHLPHAMIGSLSPRHQSIAVDVWVHTHTTTCWPTENLLVSTALPTSTIVPENLEAYGQLVRRRVILVSRQTYSWPMTTGRVSCVVGCGVVNVGDHGVCSTKYECRSVPHTISTR